MDTPQLNPQTIQVLTISRADRWQAQQRLQELAIPCHLQPDGYLAVEIHHPVALLQIRSVIRQLTASRNELLDWLKQCWQTSC